MRPLLLAVTLAGLVACGGGGNPAGSSPTTNAGSVGATVTITSAGVSPKTVTIRVGERVSFANQDSVSHEMASNPHPEHTDCPAINQLGTIAAGQTKTTADLTTARTCGYHDHLRDTNTALQGTTVIQ
jgi:plastocyanin